jgi:hypothetical protein
MRRSELLDAVTRAVTNGARSRFVSPVPERVRFVDQVRDRLLDLVAPVQDSN